jgi:membrane protein insertase Oxa1/YidC/SpoIIIJ
MNSQLSNILQSCNIFTSNRNQQHFQSAFQHVENLRTNIQTWGLKQLTILGTQIDEKVKVINSEIDNILVKKSEIESLKSNVESLIQPAVAGSLSKSFSDRKSDLKKNQRIWFWASVISSFIGAIATAYIINSLVGIFNSAIITEAIKKNINAGAGIIWTTIILRLGLLIPIYSIFGFSFMQFKKERDLEEIYAHKSAVAASLPNYGNLAIEDKVKDQVLSEASKVIFIAPNCKANDKEKSDIPSLDQLNNLIGNLQNLVSKAKE